jgi:hypothetical protein
VILIIAFSGRGENRVPDSGFDNIGLSTEDAEPETPLNPDAPSSDRDDIANPLSPQPAPTSLMPGFMMYESEAYDFSIQFPVGWFLDDALTVGEMIAEMHERGITHDEIIELIIETYNIDLDDAIWLYDFLQQDILDESDVVAVRWMDFASSYNNMVPNVNITIVDAYGATQNDMKSTFNQMQIINDFDYLYTQMFDEHKFVIDLEGIIFGNNYFLVYAIEYRLGFVDIALFQAMTEYNGNLYIFSAASAPHQLNSFVPVFTQMLSSLEFTSTQAPPSAQAPSNADFNVYQNNLYGFRIQYPDSWSMTDNFLDETIVVFSFYPADFSYFHNAHMVVFDAEGMTLNDFQGVSALGFTLAVETELAKLFDSVENIFEAQSLTFGQNQFVCFAYKVQADGTYLAIYGALTIHNNNLYRIEFSTFYDMFSESLELYNDMLTSLEFFS